MFRMKYFFLPIVFTCILNIPPVKAQLLSPDEFLPHRLGTQFTSHHLLVDYFEYLAGESNNIILQPYGKSYQQRPLFLAIISAEKNMARLEEIRQKNLRLAGLLEGAADTDDPVAIVWLSYSVHGNEPSGSESAMAVAYKLLQPDNTQTKEWLKNTVVILDPSLNPDGYERYTHWFRNVAHQISNPQIKSREHREPWPGGRVNHYLYDLNRDWAWLTQQESRQRIIAYQQWLPQVHSDLHEQYPNNPYYFAPAAEPFHTYITPWQREFQTLAGKNHIRYFDKNGWLYFTRDVFDLFYPSYGDTYPTFNGAIGMTYEQAGHSVGGRSVLTNNGDTLTLAQRIEHHFTTSLSTIEVSSNNAQTLIENFKNYFKNAVTTPQGDYKTFIIKNKSSDAAKVRALTDLLDHHQIRYGSNHSTSEAISAFNYQTGDNDIITIQPNDLIISAYQPKSVLAQVLLEPDPILVDSLTYDITSWSLPYAYGLEAYATKQRIAPTAKFKMTEAKTAAIQNNPYAILVPWNSVVSAAFLSSLIKQGIKVRYARQPFKIEDVAYDVGTLIITQADNRKTNDWAEVVRKSAAAHQLSMKPASTGFAQNGRDFGSDKVEYIEAPRIALIYGEGVNENSYGFVWHFLEQSINYPFSAIEIGQINNSTLKDYSVLILPEGQYLKAADINIIEEWIKDGGKVISIGNVNEAFAGREGWALRKKEIDTVAVSKQNVQPYTSRERDHISTSTPGAIAGVRMDESHPLSFGLERTYFSLRTSSESYALLDEGANAGYLPTDYIRSGFIGYELLLELENSLVFGVENKGRGKIIYLIDDPLFRGFWYNGKLLFSNALFLN